MRTVIIVGALVAVSSGGAQTTRPSGPECGDVRDAEASPEARARSLASSIQSLRAQLELYRLQHNGYPTIEQFKDWRVPLKLTTAKGEVVEKQTGEKVYGPYLLRVPSNPLTGLTRVSNSNNVDGETGWTTKKAHVRPCRCGCTVCSCSRHARATATPRGCRLGHLQ